MSFVGFENLGQQFAPLADAQLKQAYQDYQAQKDINASQRQLEADRAQAQEAAFKYGIESPLASKVAIDPIAAEQLGKKPTPEGEDPFAHMQDFIGSLNKQYPGVVDEQGKISPAVYGRLMKMRQAQQELESEAAKLAQRRAGEMELLQAKQKGQLQLEGVRSKNMAARMANTQDGRESPQQRLLREEIKLRIQAQADPFTDEDQRLALQAQVEDLKAQYNAEQVDPTGAQVARMEQRVVPQPAPKAAPKPVQKAAPKAAPKVSLTYEQWLSKHGAPDTKKNKDFYNSAIKGK